MKPQAVRARTAFLAHRARDDASRTQRKETFGLRVRRGRNAGGVPERIQTHEILTQTVIRAIITAIKHATKITKILKKRGF